MINYNLYWRALMCCTIVKIPKHMVCFILVSFMDLFMTYILLHYGKVGILHGYFYESNIIANHFFSYWDITGLVMFKAAMVSFICTVIHIISRTSRKAAQRVTLVAIWITWLVVMYGFCLFILNYKYM